MLQYEIFYEATNIVEGKEEMIMLEFFLAWPSTTHLCQEIAGVSLRTLMWGLVEYLQRVPLS